LNSPASQRRWLDTFLAWYFVSVWGSGFVATKIGLQHAAPFTFLALRFAIGLACVIPYVLVVRPRWPATRIELVHVLIAGALMHLIHLGGSHYGQYLGLSAGIVALILCLQPLITALIAARWLSEKLAPHQWIGVALGLAGIALVVWHKFDVKAMSLASLVAVSIGLTGITAGSLYQKRFCPAVDLRAATPLQFAVAFAGFLPLSLAFENSGIRWSWALAGALFFLVVFASVFAVSAFYTLLRHGAATRVTSLIYLTPVFAVGVEYLLFGVVPTALSVAGIVVTCAGVAMVSWRRSGSVPA
jgi:drug/metabolite transporter (DMT)-like permease